MPINSRPLILASTAPWRADILRKLNIDFEVMAPPYKESFPEGALPKDIASYHAKKKAHASAVIRPDAFILAADQTAEFMQQCLQKPKDLNACVAQLTALQGHIHYLHSAIALYNPLSRETQTHVVTVTLDMLPLSTDEISRYVDEDKPIGCVGSYKFELGGKRLFRHIDQDESSIVGLPLTAVSTLLTRAGLSIDSLKGA